MSFLQLFFIDTLLILGKKGSVGISPLRLLGFCLHVVYACPLSRRLSSAMARARHFWRAKVTSTFFRE